MTRATPATPRTAAGADLLARMETTDLGTHRWMMAGILAIEAEMDAGLDVDWHYCDLDSKHHQRAEAAQPAADGLLPKADLERGAAIGHAIRDAFKEAGWSVNVSEGTSWEAIGMHVLLRLAAPPRPHDEGG